MTVTAASYAATIGGTPFAIVEDSGDLEFDASRSPHVSGSITLKATAAALAATDPRVSPPPRVVLTASGRVSNLHIRERTVDQREGQVTLTLASDEGLLADYAPLVDDDTPFSLQTSVRSIVNYVLNKVIPGTALQAAPGVDADVTAYWDVTNLLANGGCEGTLAPWQSGGNCTLFQSTLARTGTGSCGFTSSAAGLLAVYPHAPGAGPNVTPGKAYMLFGYARQYQASPARTARACIRWLNAAGVPVGPDVEGPDLSLSDTAWSARPYITATAPAGASKAEVFWRVAGSTAAGQIGYIDDAMFYEGNRLIPFFSGATPGDANYTYGWATTANASASYRKAIIERSPDSLVWRAGVSALAFLIPLLQARALRPVCDEQRRWTLRDETYTGAGSLQVRQGVNIVEASDTLSREGGFWFDARVTRYTWTDRDGIQQTRADAYALTPTYSRLSLLEIDAPYPGPGRSEYAVRRAQGIGREVTVETAADWTAAAEQPLQVILDNTPTLVGLVRAVRFDLATDRMQITTRTTDIPFGAVDLLTGTVDALTGTVDAL